MFLNFCNFMWTLYTFSLMPMLWKVNSRVHIWRLRCLHSPLTKAGHFADRWSSFAHNQKHSRLEHSIMKNHLTPESNYILSAAAKEAYKWQLSLGFKALGPPWSRQGRGAMCTRMLWQSYHYYFKAEVRRGLLGKRERGDRATQKACIITTRWEGFVSSLECNRLLKLCLIAKIKKSRI